MRSGAIAIVVDGLVRNLERLGTLGLHVFARGLTPRGVTPRIPCPRDSDIGYWPAGL